MRLTPIIFDQTKKNKFELDFGNECIETLEFSIQETTRKQFIVNKNGDIQSQSDKTNETTKLWFFKKKYPYKKISGKYVCYLDSAITNYVRKSNLTSSFIFLVYADGKEYGQQTFAKNDFDQQAINELDSGGTCEPLSINEEKEVEIKPILQNLQTQNITETHETKEEKQISASDSSSYQCNVKQDFDKTTSNLNKTNDNLKCSFSHNFDWMKNSPKNNTSENKISLIKKIMRFFSKK